MSAEDFLSSRIWRDPVPHCPRCAGDMPKPVNVPERTILVERVIAAERRARIAELKARAALAEHPRDEITHLATRIIELEDTVEKLNRRLAAKNRKGAA